MKFFCSLGRGRCGVRKFPLNGCLRLIEKLLHEGGREVNK